MRYIAQKDNYGCTPVTCKMILDYIDPDNDLKLEDLYLIFETDEDGTYTHQASRALRALGYNVKRLNKKNIEKMIDESKPIWVTYKTSLDSWHSSVVNAYEPLDGTDDVMLYLYDPYFGKNFKLSIGILECLEPKFYIISL